MISKQTLRRLGVFAACWVALAAAAHAADFRIGVINLNKALNESEAGQRSKKVLLASRNQLENELKAKEASLKTLAADLKDNIMLTEATRQKKEQDLRAKESELRQDVQSAQKELQEQERKLTDSIFTELKSIVNMVAKEHNLDAVLEQAAAQAILFSKLKFIDITDEVIARYDKIQASKS
jgi:outer membrane protein